MLVCFDLPFRQPLPCLKSILQRWIYLEGYLLFLLIGWWVDLDRDGFEGHSGDVQVSQMPSVLGTVFHDGYPIRTTIEDGVMLR